MNTTTSRPHATTRAASASRTSRTSRATSSTGSESTAFVSEVRRQWALATGQHDDAVARGDDGASQEARERLDELRELLSRNDMSLDLLRLGPPL